jgi:uncharacterized membrane protein YbjE (DUF340 family)
MRVKMSLFVVACVSSGFLIGLVGRLAGWTIPKGHLDGVILGILLVLLFAVGLDLGARGNAWGRVRSLGARLLAVPVVSAAGSLGGVAFVAAFAWGYPARQACALGSAFGWYSFSGPVLTALAGPEIGAVAFLSDVLRELTALAAIPIVARLVGTAEAVALGGATSMDTTLPVLARVRNGEATPLAFAHGLILALVVPVLLPFWFSF